MKTFSTFLFGIIAILITIGQSLLGEENQPPPIAQRHFVIIVTAHNAGTWYKINLGSIVMQHYNNFHVIYINYGSTDETASHVEEFIKEYGLGNRVTLINSSLEDPLGLIHQTIHTCADDDIIMIVHGTDFLFNKDALGIINKAYANTNVWLTYGNCAFYPDNVTAPNKDIPPVVPYLNCFREYDFCITHPLTFYAGLFKQISFDAFLKDSTFYKDLWELTFTFPLLELAGNRFFHVPDFIYAYNHPFSPPAFPQNYKQRRDEKLIRTQQRLTPVANWHSSNKNIIKTDLIVFVQNNVSLSLSSVTEQHPGIENVYTVSSEKTAGNLPELLIAILRGSSADYILFSQDSCTMNNIRNLADATKALESTNAFAFYFDRDMANAGQAPIPANVAIGNNIRGWQFKNGTSYWHTPKSFSCALYRKQDCIEAFKDLTAHSIDELLALWNSQQFSLSRVGLCFENSKASICN